MTDQRPCANPGCRNGGTDDAGNPRPAQVTTGACDSCRLLLDRALGDFIEQYLALYFALEPGRTGSERVSGGDTAAPTPLNEHADALMSSMVSLLEDLEDRIREECRLTPPPPARSTRAGFALTRAVTTVRAHLDHLVRHDVAGDTFEEVLQLRSQVIGFLGQYKGKTRLPMSCPACESRSLVRWNGSDSADCENPDCRRTFPIDIYDHFLIESLNNASTQRKA